MKFIELKNIQKEDLKKTAKKLRELMKLRKPSYNKQTIPLYVIAQQIDDQKYQFRHKHIAYCQFFNNTEYVLSLEFEGSSKQAPAGWVRSEKIRMENKLNEAFGAIR